MPDFDSLAACLAERILSVPRFRQVLRTQPLDLGAPQWVDDPNVDISHYLRRAALPRPGDDAALFRWVAEVMERRLDRDRPLWECWIVDGLQHNRWAILIKIHHCMADGNAATRRRGDPGCRRAQTDRRHPQPRRGFPGRRAGSRPAHRLECDRRRARTPDDRCQRVGGTVGNVLAAMG